MNDLNQLLDEASAIVREAQSAVYALDEARPKDLVWRLKEAMVWGLMSAFYLTFMLLPLWLVIYFS